MVEKTPHVWKAWFICSWDGYVTAASIMIHQPVKNWGQITGSRWGKGGRQTFRDKSAKSLLWWGGLQLWKKWWRPCWSWSCSDSNQPLFDCRMLWLVLPTCIHPLIWIFSFHPSFKGYQDPFFTQCCRVSAPIHEFPAQPGQLHTHSAALSTHWPELRPRQKPPRSSSPPSQCIPTLASGSYPGSQPSVVLFKPTSLSAQVNRSS